MGMHLWLFVGIAAVVIVVPGPDTALVTKHAVLHGRRAGLATTAGVCTGLTVWTIAAALGIASLVRASDVAFTVLKLIGAGYLMWLGVRRSERRAMEATRTRSAGAAAKAWLRLSTG